MRHYQFVGGGGDTSNEIFIYIAKEQRGACTQAKCTEGSENILLLIISNGYLEYILSDV